LRIPSKRGHPHVFSNFVTTLDGVVSLNSPGHASGGDISGFSAQDRMVMGLLRAIADVVIIGTGTLGADSRHVWTADAIFPELADEYRRLRKDLKKSETPLNVVVSGSGSVDLHLPIFASGKVNTLILTTTAGERCLRREAASDSVEIRAIGTSRRAIPARAILDEVCRMRSNRLILVEGGSRLLGDFYAEHLIDEQFLTIAPQVAGREGGNRRPGLVTGKTFAPGDARWGTLTDLRLGGSHLFLRYSFSGSRPHSQAGSP
jgi:riboflavin biosynthesis pyrimidine reductase